MLWSDLVPWVGTSHRVNSLRFSTLDSIVQENWLCHLISCQFCKLLTTSLNCMSTAVVHYFELVTIRVELKPLIFILHNHFHQYKRYWIFWSWWGDGVRRVRTWTIKGRYRKKLVHIIFRIPEPPWKFVGTCLSCWKFCGQNFIWYLLFNEQVVSNPGNIESLT